MEEIDNFVIDYKKVNFYADYRLFLKKKHISSLRILLILLTLSIVTFFLIKTFANWKIIESISVALIVLVANFVFFKIYDLLTINKKIERNISQVSFGKINMSIQPTIIELNQNGRKKVIFLSQLEKCIVISDVLFFIEKKKVYLPVKINRTEMTNGAFDKLIEKLKSLKVSIG